MSRISLYQKLSKSPDFDKTLKKIKLVDDPKKYVKDTFLVSSSVAARFVEEMEIRSVKLSKGQKEEVKDLDIIKLRAFTELEALKKKINNEPGHRVLIEFGDRLEEFKPSVISEIFISLYGEQSKTRNLVKLKRAIKYMIQKLYYKEVFKVDIPKIIEERVSGLISLCMISD